jgi:hypothetical protein
VSEAFHLGESGIDIGISVDEGVPYGYDGVITSTADGRYQIEFANGGGTYRFSSIADAQASYPQYRLLMPDSATAVCAQTLPRG